MKLMRRDLTITLRHSGSSNLAATRRAAPWRLAISRIVACAILAQCLGPAQAADALSGTEPPLAQKRDYMPKGRQMERYKAFARQAEMPAITVANKTTLEVDGTVKTDLARLAQLSIQEKEALTTQLGVPAAVIGKVVERAAHSPQPDAAQLAQDIRTAVVDYRFLQGEWKRYNPPAEGLMIKTNALQALQSGDISTAWELYDGLQRPAPPGNLRIVSQP
jgi:hypothetical protein